MPKSIVIEPERIFTRALIAFSPIPVNAYDRPIEDEAASYTRAELLAIWQDMCGIREFETVLSEIKTKGVYKGTTYTHAGPAHLSIGQEAAAVGMAFSLGPDDHIFGSHRSHGEILAKAFSAIRQMERRPADGDHGELSRRRAARSGRSALRRVGRRARAPVLHLRRLQRNLRAGDRLQSRPRRLDACVLRAVRHLPEQRHRRRLGLDRARRRALQARQSSSPASSSPTSATRRSAAGRSGKASPSRPWTNSARSGTRRWAAGCRSCSTA